MADSTDSVSSWPGFVGQLNKTFMLVRDAFGYALPGGVFLAIGLMYGRFNLWQVQSLLLPYHMPVWMAFLAIVAACYAVGGVMAAVAYMPFMLVKYAVWICDRHWPEKRTETGAELDTTPQKSIRTWLTEWLADHPTEVTGPISKIRLQHHELTDSLDRRETLTILAGSITAALLTGWYIFYCEQWGLHEILFAAGVVTLIQFLTGLPHLRRVAKAVREADADVTKTDPDLAQLLGALVKAAKDVLGKIAS
jgi:hypothetical protein